MEILVETVTTQAATTYFGTTEFLGLNLDYRQTHQGIQLNLGLIIICSVITKGKVD